MQVPDPVRSVCLCVFRWLFSARAQALSQSVYIWWSRAANHSSDRPFSRVYPSPSLWKHGKHTHMWHPNTKPVTRDIFL